MQIKKLKNETVKNTFFYKRNEDVRNVIFISVKFPELLNKLSFRSIKKKSILQHPGLE